MRTLFTTIAIATSLGGVALAAAPAEAQPYGYHHRYDHRGWHHREWREHHRWVRHHGYHR